MKRNLITKRMLTLFMTVVLMSSLFMTFATPTSATPPDCENPDCINPPITVCEDTEFNDALLEANGVGCNPIPGTYLAGTEDEYTITVSYDFIQNAIPNQPGTDLENTKPGEGDYYYHVFCTKYRVVYQDSCSCASVGYIHVEECVCHAEDIYDVCVDDVLTEGDIITMGNVSCDGEGCAIDSIDMSAVDTSAPGVYTYYVTCYSATCGYSYCDADVYVEECIVGECCECYAPDVTICEGDDVEAAINAAGPVCTGENCAMTLDISGVNNMAAGDYSYTVTCENGSLEVCQGTVTVEKVCIADAPDFKICLGDTLVAPPGICTVDCDVNVDWGAVDECTPGTYPYTVYCTDPCGSECGSPVAQGNVTILASLDVEIIEAAGYEKYTDPYSPCSDNFVGSLNCDWKDVCPPPVGPDPGGRMIVPVSSVYGVKAVIENASGCILYDVTPYIIIDGPAELVEGMPNHWDLGNMEGGDDADCTEVAWTLHCTGPGIVMVTVMINDCAVDTVCFDQRIPGELVLTCDTVCEVCTDCDLDDFPVNAHITNTGQTAIEEVFATITWDDTMATVNTPPSLTQGPFIIGPGVTKDLSWDAECLGTEGTAGFTITVTGYDICQNEAITPLVCNTSTEQVDITVNVEVDPLACATPPAANGIVVSRLQQFEVIADINNCSTEDEEIVSITLTLPANSALSGAPVRIWDPVALEWYTVPASLTITDLTICDCCTAKVIWPLICTGSTGGPVPIVVTVNSNCCEYTNACNPASITQEDKVHLTPSMGLFVEDCDTTCWIPVEVVAEDQYYDVKIWVENKGEAVAENVTMDIDVSGNTTCIGFYDDMVFGDGIIPGNTMEWVWLSDLIECPELYCTAEGDVTVTLTDLKGIDENTCLPVLEDNIDDVCPLEFPQCDIDIEIINPVTCTDIEQWEVFAVKAQVTNCGDCSFEDAALTLMWEGDVVLVEGSANPANLVEILPPDEDCEELCRVYEATWMMRCIGAPGEVYFDVCLETATPHLQIKSPQVNVHQVPRDQALVCVDILSPDAGSKYATSEEFAITAEITNLECCAPITINVADIDIGGIPWQVDNIEVSDPMPPLDWVIGPGESKIVTWTAHCTGSGLSWFNVHIEGMSDEYEPVYVDSDPVSVWQYPAAHLKVEITGYPEEPIVTSTIFDVTYTVTNTGEADATEVYATLSVEPEGSVRVAGPSDGGYTQYLGTIPGHGSEASMVTANYTLHCKVPCDSTIKITVEGNDEYGWHMKQQCASTGNFVIEGGIEMEEGLNDSFVADMADDGWFAGLFYGDANGLFGPFNATSPVSWAAMGGGPDYTGEVALMGAVIPSVSLATAETLSQYMCSCNGCLYNPDCACEDLCELIKGRDVMIFIGHITSDTAFDELPDTQEFLWVNGGLLQIINGQLSGSYIKSNCDGLGDVWVKSLLGGEYCSNMAATAGIPILEGFIKPDEVTVKQLPMLTDLDIDKDVDEPNPTMGDTVEFTVTLTNLGPSIATSVMVMDVLPAGLGFDSYTADQGWYDETSGYWAVGDLFKDEVATLTIVTKVNTVGDVCNRATVEALDQHDPVTTNNMAEACVDADEPEPTDNVTLDLDLGQNLISLPLMPDEADPTVALSGVDFVLAAMMEGSSKTTYSFEVYVDGGTPTAGFLWEDGYGYWLEVSSSGETLVITGEELPSGAVLPPSYDVAGGWNLIGFKSVTAKMPTEYLAGIAGKYVMIYGYDNGAFYAVGSPGHKMLEFGHGYWLAVKVGESGTIFP